MADSDSLFDDDDFAESFAGEPSEELLRESEGSFGDLGGLDSDTPDAGIPQEELIAKAQAEAAAEDDSEPVMDSEAGSKTDDAVVAAKPAKKKGRFSPGSFDTSQITIFDLALLISLIFISVATLMMFFELRQFGNFPFDGFPWRTDKF